MGSTVPSLGTFGEVVLWVGKGSEGPLSGHDCSCWLHDSGDSP